VIYIAYRFVLLLMTSIDLEGQLPIASVIFVQLCSSWQDFNSYGVHLVFESLSPDRNFKRISSHF